MAKSELASIELARFGLGCFELGDLAGIVSYPMTRHGPDLIGTDLIGQAELEWLRMDVAEMGRYRLGTVPCGFY